MDLRHLNEPCIIISHDLTPVHHGATGHAQWCSVSPRTSAARPRTRPSWRGRCAFPAVVGLKDASERIGDRPVRAARWFQRRGHHQSRPTRRCSNTASSSASRSRSRKNCAISSASRRHAGWPARILSRRTSSRPRTPRRSRPAARKASGLFRTEYLFINRDTLPTEEEQYQAYRQVAAALETAPGHHPHARSGRRQISLASASCRTEMNPFLGWRAIRFCLAGARTCSAPSCAPSCAPAPRATSR